MDGENKNTDSRFTDDELKTIDYALFVASLWVKRELNHQAIPDTDMKIMLEKIENLMPKASEIVKNIQ